MFRRCCLYAATAAIDKLAGYPSFTDGVPFVAEHIPPSQRSIAVLMESRADIFSKVHEDVLVANKRYHSLTSATGTPATDEILYTLLAANVRAKHYDCAVALLDTAAQEMRRPVPTSLYAPLREMAEAILQEFSDPSVTYTVPLIERAAESPKSIHGKRIDVMAWRQVQIADALLEPFVKALLQLGVIPQNSQDASEVLTECSPRDVTEYEQFLLAVAQCASVVPFNDAMLIAIHKALAAFRACPGGTAFDSPTLRDSIYAAVLYGLQLSAIPAKNVRNIFRCEGIGDGELPPALRSCPLASVYYVIAAECGLSVLPASMDLTSSPTLIPRPLVELHALLQKSIAQRRSRRDNEIGKASLQNDERRTTFFETAISIASPATLSSISLEHGSQAFALVVACATMDELAAAGAACGKTLPPLLQFLKDNEKYCDARGNMQVAGYLRDAFEKVHSDEGLESSAIALARKLSTSIMSKIPTSNDKEVTDVDMACCRALLSFFDHHHLLDDAASLLKWLDGQHAISTISCSAEAYSSLFVQARDLGHADLSLFLRERRCELF